MEKQKEYNQHYLLTKVRTTWEKRRTGTDSRQTNATKTMSDVFRHLSRTGKSYCQTRSNVGSETVKNKKHQADLPRYYATDSQQKRRGKKQS
jgi:hypothetical protein